MRIINTHSLITVCLINFLLASIMSTSEHQLHQTQLPDNEARAKAMMSALSNPVGLALSPRCRRSKCREKGGRRGMCNVQLFAMTSTNGSALHSLTWYSCINSLSSPDLTSGRDNALPCLTDASCEVSCLINRTIPVMFQSYTFGLQHDLHGR